jgi:hypothetical protein
LPQEYAQYVNNLYPQQKSSLPGKKTMSLGQHIIGTLGYIVTRINRHDKTDTALKVVFLSLQMVDLTLTVIAARSGYPELNPFMKASLDSLYKLAIFKFFIPFLISWFIPGRLLIPAILLLAGVVGWNVKELISLALAY